MVFIIYSSFYSNNTFYSIDVSFHFLTFWVEVLQYLNDVSIFLPSLQSEMLYLDPLRISRVVEKV
jgi:hypothetical protein